MKHQRKDRERMKPPKSRNEFAYELQEKKIPPASGKDEEEAV